MGGHLGGNRPSRPHKVAVQPTSNHSQPHRSDHRPCDTAVLDANHNSCRRLPSGCSRHSDHSSHAHIPHRQKQTAFVWGKGSVVVDRRLDNQFDCAIRSVPFLCGHRRCRLCQHAWRREHRGSIHDEIPFLNRQLFAPHLCTQPDNPLDGWTTLRGVENPTLQPARLSRSRKHPSRLHRHAISW